jgi:hypothetical protein
MQCSASGAGYRIALLSILAAAPLPAQEHAHPPGAPTTETAEPPIYDNLGTLHRQITTTSQVAQQYFYQGLRLTYAFYHDEAIKSFQQGVKNDSTCAMCYWGIAYALGPNINLPMDTSAVAPAYQASQQALKYSANATPVERAYIEALTKRYALKPPADRAPLDSAGPRRSGLSPTPIPRTTMRRRSMPRH